MYQKLFEFIWKSRCDKLKREIVTQNFLNSALKIINIHNFKAFLKRTWFKKLTMSQAMDGYFKAISVFKIFQKKDVLILVIFFC